MTHPVLVYAYEWLASGGGHTCLHKLCQVLTQRGADAYLVGPRAWPSWPAYGNRLKPDGLDPQDCTVIYPELERGNPAGGGVVVRWLLGPPDRYGPPPVYGPNDLLVAISPWAGQGYTDETLNVFEPWPEHFRLPGPDEPSRNGTCYAVHKGAAKAQVLSLSLMTPLPSLLPAEVGPVFRRSNQFLSFDADTFLLVAAGLCGCPAVAVPDAGVGRQAYRDSHPLHYYGVGYGTADLAYARATVDRVPGWVEGFRLEGLAQADRLLTRIEDAWRKQ